MTTGTSAVQQLRPVELLDVLTADFQRRAEPQFAWKSCVSQFLALPGLRAFWPMSSLDYTAANRVIDLSGQGNHLTATNAPTFGFDQLAPYVNLVSASSQYLTRADGGAGNWADILGTETYIISGQRGLTLGGWFQFDVLAINEFLMAKWSAGALATRAYALSKQPPGTNNTIIMGVVDPVNTLFSVESSNTVGTSDWHFIAGRFTPSTEIAVFVDNVKTTNTTSPVASINDSTLDFVIGSRSTLADYLDGRASMCFLCASALSDAIIGQLYEQSRVMYGVI